MYVVGGTATLYGCTFNANVASEGRDIHNAAAGVVTVNGDFPGFTSSCTTEGALENYGTIAGTPNSFSGCTTLSS